MSHVARAQLAADIETGAPAAIGREIFRSTKPMTTTRACRAASGNGGRPSHCKLLHGYALAFKFVFATRELDARNWCYDFGGLKPVRAWLHETFDHTTLVAEDDPERPAFEALRARASSICGSCRRSDARRRPATCSTTSRNYVRRRDRRPRLAGDGRG